MKRRYVSPWCESNISDFCCEKLRQLTDDATESVSQQNLIQCYERLQSSTNIQINILDGFIGRLEQVDIALRENRDQVFESREVGDESAFAASCEEVRDTVVTT
jgi:hypothetical protein